MKKNAGRTAAVLTVLVMVGSGCSCRPPQAQQPASPTLGPIATVTSPEAISLPIDAYTPTSAQVMALQRAIDVVSAQCMQRYGLPYHPPIMVGLSDAARQNKMRTALYGFFDLGTARSKGYDTQPTPEGSSSTAGGAPYSAVEMGVLDGRNISGETVTVYNRKKVPDGGCRQEGMNALGGPPPVPAGTALPDGGPKAPATDPRMMAVNARWAACMSGNSVTYANPWAAYSDPKWTPAPSGSTGPSFTHTPEEIATATLDVECKLSTNLIGVAVAVETAYDNQYIASHASQLETFEQHLANRLRRAAQLTASK